jgi:hypothetical protein
MKHIGRVSTTGESRQPTNAVFTWRDRINKEPCSNHVHFELESRALLRDLNRSVGRYHVITLICNKLDHIYLYATGINSQKKCKVKFAIVLN